jgi:uncharacterized repeat protein (TIGR03803 family)
MTNVQATPRHSLARPAAPMRPSHGACWTRRDFAGMGVAWVAAMLGGPSSTAAANPARMAVGYRVLHHFVGADGFKSQSALIPDGQGDWLGTAFAGGAIGRGDGTAYRLSSDGRLTPWHSFDGRRGGEGPAGLLRTRDGSIYGVTTRGGLYLQGTVFRLSPAGRVTVLHAFEQNGHDGSTPQAGLIEASDGMLYGTTTYGGRHGWGCVFRMAPDGGLRVLHSFDDDGEDGVGPAQAALMQAVDGAIYGVTHGGGRHGHGTVFRLRADGTAIVLHAFDGAGGGAPAAALLQAPDGRLYGTAARGGAQQLGTLYRLEHDGALTVLHHFSGRDGDGAVPVGDLVLGRDGWLHGVTERGGRRDGGTVYRISLDGRFQRLHSFDPDGAGGYTPRAGLVETAEGDFIGTTYQGGAHDAGGIFWIRVR